MYIFTCRLPIFHYNGRKFKTIPTVNCWAYLIKGLIWDNSISLVSINNKSKIWKFQNKLLLPFLFTTQPTHNRQSPDPHKRLLCIDSCTYDPFKQNLMSPCYMVFDKPTCNNREVPLYFHKKIYVESMSGLHMNYFDIGEF